MLLGLRGFGQSLHVFFNICVLRAYCPIGKIISSRLSLQCMRTSRMSLFNWIHQVWYSWVHLRRKYVENVKGRLNAHLAPNHHHQHFPLKLEQNCNGRTDLDVHVKIG